MAKLFVLFAIPCLLGCGSRYAEQHKALTEIINGYRPELSLADYKVCLIIPSEGCLECIVKTRNFAKQNLTNRSILLITSTTSRKLLLLNWTAAELNYPNVIVDTKDLAHVRRLISTGPAIFFIDRGTLKNYQMISNATDTEKLFDIVEEYLKD